MMDQRRPDDQFANHQKFALYLAEQGWLAQSAFNSVECACAAFELTQRRRGSDAAREAMNKAAIKAL